MTIATSSVAEGVSMIMFIFFCTEFSVRQKSEAKENALKEEAAQDEKSEETL